MTMINPFFTPVGFVCYVLAVASALAFAATVFVVYVLRIVVMERQIISSLFVRLHHKLSFASLFCIIILCGCGSGGRDIVKGNPDKDNTMVNNHVPKWISGNSGMPLVDHDGLLNMDIIDQIRRDYMSRYGGPYYVWFSHYYGTYNDCVTVITGGGDMGIVSEIIIGQTFFTYLGARTIIAWKEGHFYTLPDAYDQGLLTNEDLRKIAYYHHGEERNLENHAGLAWHIISRILQTYFFNNIWPYFPEADWVDDTWIEKYYGSYGYLNHGDHRLDGDVYYIAVMVATEYDDYTDKSWETTVANTLFSYSNENRILLWKSGTRDEWELGICGHLYELQEAYDLGFLTEDDVRSIAYYHETETAISYRYHLQKEKQ